MILQQNPWNVIWCSALLLASESAAQYHFTHGVREEYSFSPSSNGSGSIIISLAAENIQYPIAAGFLIRLTHSDPFTEFEFTQTMHALFPDPIPLPDPSGLGYTIWYSPGWIIEPPPWPLDVFRVYMSTTDFTPRKITVNLEVITAGPVAQPPWPGVTHPPTSGG